MKAVMTGASIFVSVQALGITLFVGSACPSSLVISSESLPTCLPADDSGRAAVTKIIRSVFVDPNYLWAMLVRLISVTCDHQSSDHLGASHTMCP
ncbi:hypothetical protein F4804DRAFT_301409 [Jackrogersella minutella]|nr:hypothetical protein F4804DRAFT_301409 [Jackrogersella minutella]